MPGRIQKIEDLVAGSLPPHNNLKIIIRGSPDFIDPQLDGGSLRFASRRGATFSAMLADNQAYLAQNAYKDSKVIYVATRPAWIEPLSLIRIGESESLGELHIVSSLIQPNGMEITDTLLVTYSSSSDQQRLPSVSLVGTPCSVFAPTAGDPKVTMLVESWHQIVPHDVLMMSIVPDILPSLVDYPVKRANLIDIATQPPDIPFFDFFPSAVNITIDAITYPNHGLINGQMVSFTSVGGLPNGLTPNVIYYIRNANNNGFQLSLSVTGPLVDMTSQGAGTHTLYIGRDVYRYEVELITETGRLPFTPAVGTTLYLKAHPLYLRHDYNEVGGSIQLDNDLGPFLIDAFHGALLEGYDTTVFLGFKTFDSFGGQINLAQTGGPLTYNPTTGNWDGYQQWQVIENGNHLILERPIISQSLLFWQRITGNFQYQKAGYFQAELDDNGEFTMSSDLLVPPWPTDEERGWVIPLMARVETQVVVQFEPQEQQVFTIPGNTLSFIRPKILQDPTGTTIRRIMLSFKSSPNSRVEIRDWEFDGPTASSLTYFILGVGETWGGARWMSGGFSIKPMFFNMKSLTARYSDGVSKYNAGYIYA